MAVRIHEDQVRLVKVVFEARYDEGYRYLDRCGETLVRIGHVKPDWLVTRVDVRLGRLSNQELGLTLNLGNEKLDISTETETELEEAEKRVRVLAGEADVLYPIIVEALGVPNTTRVGVRFWFLAPADTLEEADRFVCKVAKSDLLDKVATTVKGELRDASMIYVLEEVESGLRRRVEVSSAAIQLVGTPRRTGLPTDKGAGGVLVDIDNFTRPETGHFAQTTMFVQESFLRCRRIALDLLQWMGQQHK